MAAAGRVGLRILVVIVWLLAATTLQPGPTHAADPSVAPDPGATVPPTCAERYPATGPAGIDLLLGCIVNEVMRAYTGAGAKTAGDPPRITPWLGPIVAVGVGAAGFFLILRAIRGSAGRRLSPAAPAVWWSCPACRSLNAAGTPACYRCGVPFEPGATEMRTDADPLAPQSFGQRIDVEASDRRRGPGVER